MTALTEDRLLLDEAIHRVCNEVTSALAAMHLLKAAGDVQSRRTLLDLAIERLEAFAEVHRLLATRPVALVDVGSEISAICRAMISGRSMASVPDLRLDLPSAWIDGETARRLTFIAAELFLNALKYTPAPGGTLHVRLRMEEEGVRMLVEDDGPGIGASTAASGTGLGGALVAELIRRGDGRMTCRTGPSGTSIEVTLPFDPVVMARGR